MARILAALNTTCIIDLVTLSEMLRDHYGSQPSRWGFDHGLAAGPSNGWKGGSLHGTRTNMHFVQGGISFFVALNKGDGLADSQFDSDWHILRNAIASAAPALPDTDLFLSLHGMDPL